jgi:serine/threonine-protein kinase RsbT
MTLRLNEDFPVNEEGDIVMARRLVREFALQRGFGSTDITRIVTAASELIRNIYVYAGKGFMRVSFNEEAVRVGITLTFSDQGPGIPDIAKAMEPGYSTGRSMGMGLSGSKRLMDELTIRSEVGKGTTVIIVKWLSK